MTLIVLNDKIRKADGSLQPIRYESAQYVVAGSFLEITHDAGGGKRQLTKIPLCNVVQIIEELPRPD